jgi:small subunit ribosomal protein S1
MAKRTKRLRPREEPASSDEFARMLESEMHGGFESIAVGDRVEGVVVAMDESSMFVDIGQRSEGIVRLDEVRPEDLGQLRVGDRGEFVVSRISGSGIELAWALSAHKLDLGRIEEAKDSGLPVEAKVTGENRGGFTVELGGQRGFVPLSQMELGKASPAEEYLGRTFRFRVIEVRGRDVVLSRRALLEQEQRRAQEELLERLEEGLELEAEIVGVERFGVFVDVGAGLHALVPRTELAWSEQDEVLRILEPGMSIAVKIIEIDDQGPKPKITASMRQIEQDPWNTVSQRLAEGERVRGRVTRLAAFGAFVEIAPGIEGLLHVSEMSATRQIRSPAEIVRVGDTLDVAITSIDAPARRIGLSISALPDAELDAETRDAYLGDKTSGGGSVLADALRRALDKEK